MNIFELFGFFLLGSLYNTILITLVIYIIIKTIKKSLNDNIKIFSVEVSEKLKSINDLILLFKKEGKKDE